MKWREPQREKASHLPPLLVPLPLLLVMVIYKQGEAQAQDSQPLTCHSGREEKNKQVFSKVKSR